MGRNSIFKLVRFPPYFAVGNLIDKKNNEKNLLYFSNRIAQHSYKTKPVDKAKLSTVDNACKNIINANSGRDFSLKKPTLIHNSTTPAQANTDADGINLNPKVPYIDVTVGIPVNKGPHYDKLGIRTKVLLDTGAAKTTMNLDFYSRLMIAFNNNQNNLMLNHNTGIKLLSERPKILQEWSHLGYGCQLTHRSTETEQPWSLMA